jgi:hypothetical protein
MGDMIDGPDRFVGFGRKPSYAYEAGHSSETRPLGRMKVALGAAIIGGGIAVSVMTIIDRDREQTALSSQVEGRCYATAVGAMGLAESANARGRTVTMIFPSGMRESYPLQGLREIQCDLGDIEGIK